MTKPRERRAVESLATAALRQVLKAREDPLAAFRGALREGTQRLYARFDEGVPIADLVAARGRLVYVLLGDAWPPPGAPSADALQPLRAMASR